MQVVAALFISLWESSGSISWNGKEDTYISIFILNFLHNFIL
jgi:hypothetical protein